MVGLGKFPLSGFGSHRHDLMMCHFGPFRSVLLMSGSDAVGQKDEAQDNAFVDLRDAQREMVNHPTKALQT